MAVVFICDGCGKRELGQSNRQGDWFKPDFWYQRTDDDGTQIACSRACVKLIAERTQKTSVILPL